MNISGSTAASLTPRTSAAGGKDPGAQITAMNASAASSSHISSSQASPPPDTADGLPPLRRGQPQGLAPEARCGEAARPPSLSSAAKLTPTRSRTDLAERDPVQSPAAGAGLPHTQARPPAAARAVSGTPPPRRSGNGQERHSPLLRPGSGTPDGGTGTAAAAEAAGVALHAGAHAQRMVAASAALDPAAVAAPAVAAHAGGTTHAAVAAHAGATGLSTVTPEGRVPVGAAPAAASPAAAAQTDTAATDAGAPATEAATAAAEVATAAAGVTTAAAGATAAAAAAGAEASAATAAAAAGAEEAAVADGMVSRSSSMSMPGEDQMYGMQAGGESEDDADRASTQSGQLSITGQQNDEPNYENPMFIRNDAADISPRVSRIPGLNPGPLDDSDDTGRHHRNSRTRSSGSFGEAHPSSSPGHPAARSPSFFTTNEMTRSVQRVGRLSATTVPLLSLSNARLQAAAAAAVADAPAGDGGGDAPPAPPLLDHLRAVTTQHTGRPFNFSTPPAQGAPLSPALSQPTPAHARAHARAPHAAATDEGAPPQPDADDPSTTVSDAHHGSPASSVDTTPREAHLHTTDGQAAKPTLSTAAVQAPVTATAAAAVVAEQEASPPSCPEEAPITPLPTLTPIKTSATAAVTTTATAIISTPNTTTTTEKPPLAKRLLPRASSFTTTPSQPSSPSSIPAAPATPTSARARSSSASSHLPAAGPSRASMDRGPPRAAAAAAAAAAASDRTLTTAAKTVTLTKPAQKPWGRSDKPTPAFHNNTNNTNNTSTVSTSSSSFTASRRPVSAAPANGSVSERGVSARPPTAPAALSTLKTVPRPTRQSTAFSPSPALPKATPPHASGSGLVGAKPRLPRTQATTVTPHRSGPPKNPTTPTPTTIPAPQGLHPQRIRRPPPPPSPQLQPPESTPPPLWSLQIRRGTGEALDSRRTNLAADVSTRSPSSCVHPPHPQHPTPRSDTRTGQTHSRPSSHTRHLDPVCSSSSSSSSWSVTPTNSSSGSLSVNPICNSSSSSSSWSVDPINSSSGLGGRRQHAPPAVGRRSRRLTGGWSASERLLPAGPGGAHRSRRRTTGEGRCSHATWCCRPGALAAVISHACHSRHGSAEGGGGGGGGGAEGGAGPGSSGGRLWVFCADPLCLDSKPSGSALPPCAHARCLQRCLRSPAPPRKRVPVPDTRTRQRCWHRCAAAASVTGVGTRRLPGMTALGSLRRPRRMQLEAGVKVKRSEVNALKELGLDIIGPPRTPAPAAA
ncbi:MAG: hypothetical protein WDW38_007773 [Sanguina aurantia]